MPPHHTRPAAVSLLLACTLLLPPVPALADPVDLADGTGSGASAAPEVEGSSSDHDDHDVHGDSGPGGDVFGEVLSRPTDPYVEPLRPEPGGPQPAPLTPHDWVGPAPDPEEMPEEWRQGLPAEPVEPSTTEELMSSDTGYFAALEAEGTPSPAAEDFKESDGPSSGDSADPSTASVPPGDDASVTAAPGDGAEVTAEPGSGQEGAAAEAEAPTEESLSTMSVESQGSVKAPPQPGRTLPRELDAAPGWQYTYSCDPNNKPGMTAFANLITTHYGYPKYYTSRACLAGGTSQHYEGRAVDWPMNAYDRSQREVGDAVAQWITANDGEIARRFGIMSVIWNKKSWYLYSPRSWRDYTGPSPHTDHLHISFTWDGAMKRTSWWTGRAVSTVDHGTCRVYARQYAPRYSGRNTTPCAASLPDPPASPYPVVLPRARNDYVKIAQEHLGFSGSGVDGIFGAMTLNALLDYQRSRGIYVTGVLDNQTWAQMLSSSNQSVEEIGRFGGRTRYHVAANASRQTYPAGSADTVYVASGQLFPAALSGGAAAGATGAPLLLVKGHALPEVTRQELTRLKPSRIVVLGGTTTIETGVVEKLRALTRSGSRDSVSRVGGDDRYEVAARVAARTYPNGARTVYLASGQGFADALTGSALAAKVRGPLMLVKRSAVPLATRQRLAALNPDRIVLLGGTSTVDGTVERALKGYAPTVRRIGGLNRWAVAVGGSKDHYQPGVDTVYVASGQNFPGALTGGAVGGRSGSPVLPTKRGVLPDRVRAEIERLEPSRVIVLGGTDAVTSDVQDTIAALRW